MSSPSQTISHQAIYMDASDPQYAEAFNPSPAAFGSLYRQYLNPVYRYLYIRVGNAADAEDLTSQVFLAALEGLPRYVHQGHFAAWLFSIARRKVGDFYRRRPAQSLDDDRTVEPAAPESDLLAQLVHRDDLHRLVKQISRLPDEERELLRLRFAARLNFDEIAVVLGRKPSAVKMALYRLLDRLQVQLEVSHD